MEPSRTEILVGVHGKVQENQQETFHHLQQRLLLSKFCQFAYIALHIYSTQFVFDIYAYS
jgi:hypothetical protein